MDKGKKRLIYSILMSVIGFFILLVIVNSLRTSYAINKEESYLSAKLTTAEEELVRINEDVEEDWETYDDFIRSKVDMLVYLIDNSNALDNLEEVSTKWGIDKLYIVDESGNITNSIGSEYTTLKDAGLERFVDYINGKDDHTYKTVDGYCYYISRSDNGYYLIGGKESSEVINTQDARKELSYALENIRIGENGFVAAIDLSDDTVVYTKNEHQIGKNYKELTDTNLDDYIHSGIINFGGLEYLTSVRQTSVDDNNYLLVALVLKDEILTSTNLALYGSLGVYIITAFLIIIYSYMLRDDMLNTDMAASVKYKPIKNDYFINYSMLKRLESVGLIAILVVCILSVYFQELSNVKRQLVFSNLKLDDVETMLSNDDLRSEELKNSFDKEYLIRANNIAWTLNYDKSLLNEETIKDIANILKVPAINVYDENGAVYLTNTNYKDISLNKNSEFFDVIKGYKDSYIGNEDNDLDIIEYIGVKRLDNNGMVQIGLTSELLNRQLENTGLVHTLENTSNEYGAWLISVDTNTNTIEYCPNTRKIGLDYKEYGLDENCLKDEFVGWKNIDGSSVFLISKVHNSSIIYASVLSSSIVSGSLSLALITSLVSFILLSIVVYITCLTDKEEISESIKRVKKVKERNAYYTVVKEDGTLMDKESIEARWSGNRIDFDELDAGQKLKRIVYIIIGIIIVLFLLAYKLGLFNNNDFILFIMSEKWEYNINLFSIAYVAIDCMEIIVIGTIIRQAIVILTKPFNARVNTFGRLLESFIKYATVIYVIIKALHSFGIDTTTLIAGAGILTLVVGLGANSLIEDILAGIFIVFEGDFRVGDVVTIDDWRGIVEEIGIRTTKILGFDKNVKILRNSSISSVVNMTSEYSLASVDINVASYENLEEVEKVIEARFDHMRKEIPQIIDKIWIEGVIAYDQGSCTIRVTAPCYEEDRDDVLNRFYREFKLIYDENPDVFKQGDYSSINIVK